MNFISKLVLILSITFLSFSFSLNSHANVFDKLMSFLSNKYPSISEVEFIGKKPSELEWQFLRKYGFKHLYTNGILSPGDTLEVMSLEHRLLLSWKSYEKRFVHEINLSSITDKNKAYEDNLVKESYKLGFLEVFQVRAFLKDKSVIESEIYPGERFEVSRAVAFLKDFKEKLKGMNIKAKDIIEIEASHVHPVVEFMNISDLSTFTAPYSENDGEFGEMKGLSVFKNVLFTFKAVLPNGYSFRESYLNKKNDEFPNEVREHYYLKNGFELPQVLRQEPIKISYDKSKSNLDDKNILSKNTTLNLLREYLRQKKNNKNTFYIEEELKLRHVDLELLPRIGEDLFLMLDIKAIEDKRDSYKPPYTIAEIMITLLNQMKEVVHKRVTSEAACLRLFKL